MQSADCPCFYQLVVDDARQIGIYKNKAIETIYVKKVSSHLKNSSVNAGQQKYSVAAFW